MTAARTGRGCPRPRSRARARLAVGLRRLAWPARAALIYMLIIVLVAAFAPLLTRYDPTAVGLASPTTGPGSGFWFGVDRLGRDVFSRLVAGTRQSLIVGFASAGIALVAGSALGAVAATSRRAVDEMVMRLLDIVMAFPTIVLAALLVVAYGKGNLAVLVVAIGFVFTPQIARLVRANVASEFAEDYVAAERVIGAGRRHILARHVTRNVAAPILVWATVMVANAIVFEASLSFIGAGLPPAAAQSSWGSVIAYGEQLLASHGWWATFFPGLLILVTVLAMNILAEGISDAWAAPTERASTSSPATADTVTSGAVETGVSSTGLAESVPPVLAGLDQAAARLRDAARPALSGSPVLQVEQLRLRFSGRHRDVDILDGLSFEVGGGEVMGLVGESGCGKSLTALTIMGLQPSEARLSGRILFQGTDLLALDKRQRRSLMGRDLAMIYQDALSSLNPSMTVSAQLNQLIRRGGTRPAAELLEMVGLESARTLGAYPHELSGGQRQRVLIAMALSREARLLVADEPTTALDVTVQAQVMRLLLELQGELGFALVLVSHDLALVADVCDRVTIMYGGQIAESGPVAEVIGNPAHHYTRGLLGAVMSLETDALRLAQIPGAVPSPADFGPGCRFADRCWASDSACRDRPESLPAPGPHAASGHHAACHHPVVPLAAEVKR